MRGLWSRSHGERPSLQTFSHPLIDPKTIKPRRKLEAELKKSGFQFAIIIFGDHAQ